MVIGPFIDSSTGVTSTDILSNITRFPNAARVQLDLLREKYNISEDWIDEIKENGT
tara:strand:+ start:203 stop:370 length:168 start_codon:yes stop_codon:yes gene_type:complete